MLKEIPQIAKNAVFATVFTACFGAIGVPLGFLCADLANEALQKLIEKLIEKFGEETGLHLAESENGIFRLLTGLHRESKISDPQYALLRMLAGIWEKRLAELIATRNFESPEFQAQTALLEKWRAKFGEARSSKKLLPLYEIFPEKEFFDAGIREKAFEIVTGAGDARELLWENLSRRLGDWSDETEKKVFRSIEKDVRRALILNLENEMLDVLQKNDDFREVFHTTFEFSSTGKLNELKSLVDEILFTLKPQVDFSSPVLKKAVLKYLRRVFEAAIALNKIYPAEFKTPEKHARFFSAITQRVQVVGKSDFEAFKARIDEHARVSDSFRPTDDKKLYDQRGFETETGFRELLVPIKIYEWNEDTRREFKRRVILGDPGFGKSWLLADEAQKAAAAAIDSLEKTAATPEAAANVLKTIKIPIHLRLAELARAASPTEPLISSIAGVAAFSENIEDETDLLAAFLKETIYRLNTALLLFDALDEVPETSVNGLNRREIAAKFGQFARQYENCPVLLTSRKVNYYPVELAETAKGRAVDGTLEILAFDKPQIENYVAAWFGADSETTRIFLDLLENQPQTAGLSQNPLMLSLMCRLFYERCAVLEQENDRTDAAENRFPSSRSQIYAQCLKGFLKDWKDEKSARTIDYEEVENKIAILEETAFELFRDGAEQFTGREFRRRLRAALGIDEKTDRREGLTIEWLHTFQEDGLLIKTIDGENPQFRFLHLTFQEYLTASFLAKMPDWKDFIFEKHKNGLQNKILFNTDWQHVLRLLGGMLNPADARLYIDTLLELNGENGEGDLLFRPFALANLAAREASDSLDPLLKESLILACCNLFTFPSRFQSKKNLLYLLQNWGNESAEVLLEFLDKRFSMLIFEEILDILNNLQTGKKRILKEIIRITRNHSTELPFDIENRSFQMDLILKYLDHLPEKFIDQYVRNSNFFFRRTDFNKPYYGFEYERQQAYLSPLYDLIIQPNGSGSIKTVGDIVEQITTADQNSLIQEYFAFELSKVPNIPAEYFGVILEIIASPRTNRSVRQYLAWSLINFEEVPVEYCEKLLRILFGRHADDDSEIPVFLGFSLNKIINQTDVRKLSPDFLMKILNELRDFLLTAPVYGRAAEPFFQIISQISKKFMVPVLPEGKITLTVDQVV